ncbi:MAG: phytoene/squalene synthase family protein [Aestuariivirgaceae bacterium]|nr:phytoene/squalene synthase family protein [Aestuariivirgaceae bacterium]
MSEACGQLVRAADKDRWLASLFAPDEPRAHLMALYAFNIEVARIRETVSDPGIGEIRLQWWADTIEAIYAGTTPDHPVAQGLAAAIAHGNLDQASLFNLIEARRFDLYDDPMPDMATLEGYLGETCSVLFQMAASILAGPAARSASDVSGFGGVAYGLTGLLRALPIHRRRGQMYLPGDVLARHGVTAAEVRAGRITPGLAAVLSELRTHATNRLTEARKAASAVPADALPAFLPLSMVDGYLKALRSLGPQAVNEIAEVSQLKRQWRLWRCARTLVF